jgi:predicted TIM-barrel fold metal-dependent hydrolase
MRIVDPHVHLWNTQDVSYPWLANPGIAYSGDNRLLPQNHDVDAFLRSVGDIEVAMTVNVEAIPADPLAEAHWLQNLADTPANLGHPHGIVAHADLSQPDAPRLLEQLSACPNVCGIRQVLNVHKDPRYNYVARDYLLEQTWRTNLRELVQRSWSFDLQLYPSQMPVATEVVDANEDLCFIINHGGMFVDRDSPQGYREWRQGLRQLAARPNTALKLSGFAMFDHQWTLESLRPYVLEAIDAFGPRRCMFASNFPIDGLHSSYAALWSAYAQIVSGVSAAEREDLLVNNAVRYYRLSGRSSR